MINAGKNRMPTAHPASDLMAGCVHTALEDLDKSVAAETKAESRSAGHLGATCLWTSETDDVSQLLTCYSITQDAS